MIAHMTILYLELLNFFLVFSCICLKLTIPLAHWTGRKFLHKLPSIEIVFHRWHTCAHIPRSLGLTYEKIFITNSLGKMSIPVLLTSTTFVTRLSLDGLSFSLSSSEESPVFYKYRNIVIFFSFSITIGFIDKGYALKHQSVGSLT